MTNDPSFDPKKTCGKPCNCESYRAHLMSVAVSASATPSRDRSKETVEANAKEKSWEKDGDAYKRLRSEGLQPPHIDGSAKLEAGATDKLEVQTGKPLERKTVHVMKEIKELQKEQVSA